MNLPGRLDARMRVFSRPQERGSRGQGLPLPAGVGLARTASGCAVDWSGTAGVGECRERAGTRGIARGRANEAAVGWSFAETVAGRGPARANMHGLLDLHCRTLLPVASAWPASNDRIVN